MRVVTADNIQGITAAFDEEGDPALPFEDHVQSLIFPSDMKEKTKNKQRKKLREAKKNIPRGMKLVPVQYTRISKDKISETRDEFLEKDAKAFFHHIATKYEKELLALGFDEFAVNRMKVGKVPIDKDGCEYGWDIDHIIERAGSGYMADEDYKTDNPDWPDGRVWGSARSYIVNLFDNFYLLPRSVHKLKNIINRTQLHGIQEGETRTIYMLVPDRDENDPPFYPHMKAKPEKNPNPVSTSFNASLAAIESLESVKKYKRLDLNGKDSDIGVKAIEDIAVSINEVLEWHARTQMAADDIKGNSRTKKNAKRKLRQNMEATREKLQSVFEIMPELKLHKDINYRVFSGISPVDMSIRTSVEGIEPP